VAVRVVLPVPAVCVYVTEHVADAVEPLRVHGDVTNVPVPVLVHETVPVGVVVGAVVSVTVAVHVVAWLMKTVVKVHETVVVVTCVPTAIVADPLLVL